MDLVNDDPTKMYYYENRLQTFVGWPFEEGCVCTPENVSEPTSKPGFVGPTKRYAMFSALYMLFSFIDGQSWIYSHTVGE